MSVREAMHRINQREFAEWQLYANEEPFGEERADLRAGIIASVIANANRGKNMKPFEAQDFMPIFSEYQEEERKREKRRKVQQMLSAYFGVK